MVLLIDGQA